MAAVQPPLPFGPEPFTRDAFLTAPSNAAAQAALARWRDWPGRAFALVGAEGAGKSHLADVWAQEAGGRRIDARSLTRTVLADLLIEPAAPLALALDDADRAADGEALFHLINAAAQRGGALLLVGRTPPGRWPTILPDLASRLAALAWERIDEPEPSLLDRMLERQAKARHILLDDALRRFVAVRLPRSYAAARRFVDALDQALHRPGARIGYRLAREALAALYADPEPMEPD